jgi:ABC-2 type transport system ATP-binding protein
MSIEVSALTKLYGEQKAVDALSFTVNKGEIAGFLGPNGAGKSTTMRIITGYLQPDEGEALICGIRVKERPFETKSKIGYLPEANPLYYDMYVKEYLDFVADMHSLKLKKAKIHQVIASVGLGPESGKKIGQLSKGYKQRVGLAAALIHDPEVLILDEPTNGLDPNQIIEIREVIKNLGQEKTILFSSHILQEVQAICDRVIIINKGKLVADSKLATLREHNHAELVRISFKESIEAETFNGLRGLNSVNRLDHNQWELASDNPGDLKKQLLELALRNNLNIVSLQSESPSLETIFRNLTN